MGRFGATGRAVACCAAMAVFGLGSAPAQERGGNTVELQPLVSGLARPVFLTHAGDGSGRLFIVEKPGRVRIYKNGGLLAAAFLDITSKVEDGSNEQGLLSVAFHPGFESNRRFFVAYTRSDRALVVAEYAASAVGSDTANTAERVVIVVPHPDATNHNGGQLQFGPDGFLYISTGDGGPQGDPENDAQNRENLLGKILRIDVNGANPYAIPAGNPFAGSTPGADEIFAYGFRNPWRFSFDRATGQMYAGDVGQNQYEEINIVTNGDNLGWPIMEATHCFRPSSGCSRDGLTLPIYEYSHGSGACSVTGGYVYRGSVSASLVGTYLFADYCDNEIVGLRGGTATPLFQGANAQAITSFGEDEQGEIYAVTDSTFGGTGSVSRIVGPSGGCVLTCPTNVSAEDEDGNGSEVVTFADPTASGDCGTVTCEPESGSAFPVGTTEVNCSSSRSSGLCSFMVTVAPAGGLSVTSADPPSGARRATLAVKISGTGFEAGATVSFGTKIQVLDATVVSPTEIQASIKIKKKARRGARDVVVTNPGGASATGSGIFTVE